MIVRVQCGERRFVFDTNIFIHNTANEELKIGTDDDIYTFSDCTKVLEDTYSAKTYQFTGRHHTLFHISQHLEQMINVLVMIERCLESMR